MGLFDRLKEGLKKTSVQFSGMFASFTGANEDFFEELEETLFLADLGVEVTTAAIEGLREVTKERALRGGDELREALAEILAETLSVGEATMQLETKPAVILVIGVNGVGKTTTIGKLATHYVNSGKKVLLAAGDTFRAAAAEQLGVWAERSGADIVRHEAGSDPASVVFDALKAAVARDVDVVIVDTAGRLHNKKNLMQELSKISRVIDRELPGASRETLLVLDATTGQNGLQQARGFEADTGITGLVLTKLDGTARGGIVFAIAQELGLPVKFIGVGEKAEDLLPFEAGAFVRALLEG
ncbi:MAG: signal recognition particle-docking protein FtsY [Oscillospiraceae bacterium]|nr:signal recognition particle-docking protein FtsY [Oscillospiraceae bacterium]